MPFFLNCYFFGTKLDLFNSIKKVFYTSAKWHICLLLSLRYVTNLNLTHTVVVTPSIEKHQKLIQITKYLLEFICNKLRCLDFNQRGVIKNNRKNHDPLFQKLIYHFKWALDMSEYNILNYANKFKRIQKLLIAGVVFFGTPSGVLEYFVTRILFIRNEDMNTTFSIII